MSVRALTTVLPGEMRLATLSEPDMKFSSFGRPLGMFGAHVGLERFVAPPLIVLFHFVKRVAGEWS